MYSVAAECFVSKCIAQENQPNSNRQEVSVYSIEVEFHKTKFVFSTHGDD